MWRHVGLLRIDVSEECVASVFRVERISRLIVIANLVPSLQIISTLKMEEHVVET
jgi:hypothetical protein